MPVKGEVKWSATFALTLTLNPKLYALDPVMQRNTIQGVLNTLSYNKDLRLTVWCELTQSQNVHIHGFVQVPLNGTKTVQYIFASKVRNLRDIGHWCIKPITSTLGWYTYCTKDTLSFLTNTQCNPLLMDDLDYVGFYAAQAPTDLDPALAGSS